MRYRLMATFDGSPFEAGIGPAQGDIVLFAACPPPEHLGFEPATGHWRRQLRLSDVQAVWESRPVGIFRGERCMVLDDLGDRLHIGYLGHDGFKAEKLGYWQVDRGVFELVAPRSEITDILEERTEFMRPPAALRPDTGPLPAASRGGSGQTERSQRPSGQDSAPGGYRNRNVGQSQVPGSYSPGDTAQHSIPVAYMAVADGGTGVALPVAAHTPLPLEAEAMRAASAARRQRPADDRTDPGSPVGPANPAAPQPADPAASRPANPATPEPDASTRVAAPAAGQTAARQQRALAQARQRRSGRSRLATERSFTDLAALAGIPAESYAIGEVIDGAVCLIRTGKGFEVFRAADSGRQELQAFPNEDAAFFYLFGVLAAEAVQTGSLTRAPAGLSAG